MRGVERVTLILGGLLTFYWSLLLLILVVVNEAVLTLPTSLLRSLVGMGLYVAWLYFVYRFSLYIFYKFIGRS